MEPRQTTLGEWLASSQGSTAANSIVIEDDDGPSKKSLRKLGSTASHPIVICDEAATPISWPSSITRLESNENPVHIVFADEDVGKCFCTRVCSKDTCINAMSATYCEPRTCDAGANCGNRLHDLPSLSLMWCSKGYGVHTSSYIPKKTVLGEYRGRIITQSSLTVAQATSGYVLRFRSPSTTNEAVYIDASTGGSLGRFVNHSCVPNSRFEERSHRTGRKMAIVTHSDLHAGEEVTVKYNNNIPFECICGEDRCRARRPMTP